MCRNTTNGETSPFTDFIVAVLSGTFCKPFRLEIFQYNICGGGGCGEERISWASQLSTVSGGSVREKPARKSYQTNQCSKC